MSMGVDMMLEGVVDELHVIMMSYRGSRGAVPSPVYKADPLSRLGRSRARIPAGLEAELSYCMCIVCVAIVCPLTLSMIASAALATATTEGTTYMYIHLCMYMHL